MAEQERAGARALGEGDAALGHEAQRGIHLVGREGAEGGDCLIVKQLPDWVVSQFEVREPPGR